MSKALNNYTPFGYQLVQHLLGFQVPSCPLRRDAISVLVADKIGETVAVRLVGVTAGQQQIFPPEFYLTFSSKEPDRFLSEAREAELQLLRLFPGMLARIFARGHWEIVFDTENSLWRGRLQVAAFQDDPRWIAEYLLATGGDR